MTPQMQNFVDSYLSFLLSGNLEDFRGVCSQFALVIQSGASNEDLQGCMDQCHENAELLCLITETSAQLELGN